MKRKDELDMALFKATKVARTAIRLKHSLAADDELNDVVPALREAIEEAYANGEGYELSEEYIKGLVG